MRYTNELKKEDYLNKEFDYTLLTKPQMARILSECGYPVPNIPTTRKSEFIKIYKENIYNKIDELRDKYINVNGDNKDIEYVGNESMFSEENIFQSDITEGNRIDSNKSRSRKDRSRNRNIIDSNSDKSIIDNTSHNNIPHNISTHNVTPQNRKRLSSSFIKIGSSEQKTKGGVLHDNRSPYNKSSVKINTSPHITSPSPNINTSPRKSHINTPNINTPHKSHHTPYTPNHIKTVHQVKQHPVFFKQLKNKKKKKIYFTFFIFLSFLLIFIYLKLLCPYCINPKHSLLKNNCIPLPSNSILTSDTSNTIKCNTGYILYTSYIFPNSCILDESKKIRIEKVVCDIIFVLQEINWKYQNKMLKSNRIDINSVMRKYNIGEYKYEGEDERDNKKYNTNNIQYTNNNTSNNTNNITVNELIEEMKKRKEIIFDNNNIYTNGIKIPLLSFIYLYFNKILKITIIPFITVIITYFIYKIQMKRRRRLRVIEERASVIVKDVMEVLSVQVVLHSRDKEVSGCVAVEQMKDYFGVDEDVWNEVVRRVRRNSNVRENMGVIRGEEMRVWEWIGPIIGTYNKGVL